MLLRHIHIQNLRSIESLEWEFEPGVEAGWHVLLGNNGSGKSSVLRMIAATLMRHSALRLAQDFQEWIRRGQHNCVATLTPASDPSRTFEFEINPPKLESWKTPRTRVFSCGFGAYRQFGWSGYDHQARGAGDPVLARHLNLFGEQVVLRDCLDWLRDLQFRRLDTQAKGDAIGGDAGWLLDRVSSFIADSELLPYGVRLVSVEPDAVVFEDGQGVELAAEGLSDGYHSILSIVFELIRRLAEHFGARAIWDERTNQVTAEGVVLVDEIDAHLHPRWQREIGWTLTRCFPNLQFIVTTHSPLICQAAERGSIFRLPDPGEHVEPRVVDGLERERLLYGNVLDAYATPSFGRVPTRSDHGRERLERLAELNHKSLTVELEEAELDEREHLLRILPTGRADSSDAAE